MEKTIKIGNKKVEFFNKIMSSTNFTPAKNSLQAVQIMFDSMWPTMARLMEDNEILIEDGQKTNKMYAELDEKYKKLVAENDKNKEEIDSLRIKLQEASIIETE